MEEDKTNKLPQDCLLLRSGEGRKYSMGKMRAVFKADEEETQERYSVSEWWLDPQTEGPGAHRHENNDEVFYVLEGTASILMGSQWITASKGAFVLIAKNTLHDFANQTDATVGLLNFFIPGGFERNMPSIVAWFDANRH